MKIIKQAKLTDPKGFVGAAISAGIKFYKDKLDLMILKSERPCVSIGFFTTNHVKAAPVILGKETLKKNKGCLQAIIVNSGNANAATGKQGISDVTDIVKYVSGKIDIDVNKIIMSSTGIIGYRLPVECIKNGIDKIYNKLTKKNGRACSSAILTTDTFEKTCGVKINIGGCEIIISGAAKGAGMIAPNMATLLCYITTDLNIEKKLLTKITKECLDDSFNSITVDGDMSTNDTVLILANGMAGNKISDIKEKEEKIIKEAFLFVMQKLAKDIVADGEGATKFIEIKVSNAKTKKDAKKIAMAIANSNLVKTAFFGKDSNWGRILGAAGTAGVVFNLDKIDLLLNDVYILKQGQPIYENKKVLDKIMKKKDIKIIFDIKAGKESAVIWTMDLSYDYIKINADYHT